MSQKDSRLGLALLSTLLQAALTQFLEESLLGPFFDRAGALEARGIATSISFPLPASWLDLCCSRDARLAQEQVRYARYALDPLAGHNSETERYSP